MRYGLLLMALLVALAGCQSSPAPSAATPTPAPAPTQAAAPAISVSPAAGAGLIPPQPTLPPLSFNITGGGSNVATVNGAGVTKAEFERIATRAREYYVTRGIVDPNAEEGKKQLAEVYGQVLDLLIEQEIVRQGAKSASVSVGEAELKEALDTIIAQQGGEEGLAKALAAQNYTRQELIDQLRDRLLWTKMAESITKDMKTTSEQLHARHILVKTEDEAKKAAARVAGGEDFAAVARDVSTDPSAKSNGGDLGWVSRGQLVPTFEDAAFALAVNALSGPVQTQFGYHIIQVVEKDAARAMPEDEVAQLRQEKFEEWLAKQRETAKIERLVVLE